MTTRVLLFLIHFLLFFSCFGQSDVSKKKRKQFVDLATKNFEWTREQAVLDSAMIFANKGCEYCEKSGLDSMRMRCFYERGYVWFRKGEYGKAVKGFKKSIALAEKLDDKYMESANYSAWGSAHGVQGDHDQALEKLIYALELSEELEDSVRMATISGNIGYA